MNACVCTQEDFPCATEASGRVEVSLKATKKDTQDDLKLIIWNKSYISKRVFQIIDLKSVVSKHNKAVLIE